MPDITPGSEYLVAFLHSAGTVASNGMGLTGLSWQEIEAWVRCSDMQGIVTPKDLRTIYTLSRVYARECSVASEKGATAPYKLKVEMSTEIREMVSEKADDLFASLIVAQTRE